MGYANTMTHFLLASMTNLYALFCLMITFAVLMRYLNHRYIHIQPTIAITLGAFSVSVLLLWLNHYDAIDISPLTQTVSAINFQALLLNGMLGLFLFAGSLSIDLKALKKYQWEIGSLAFFGVIASTFVIGSGLYVLLDVLGLGMPYLYCLLFGAIISPTDPIAVLGTMKEIKAPKALSTKIAGESLFNDGIGLVIFITLYKIAFSSTAVGFASTLALFTQEAVGGLVYGFLLGSLAHYFIKNVHQAKLEILITVCMATAGYLFAQYLHISGPLAMVVSGLMVGNQIHTYSFTEQGKQHLDVFWELIDEVLNAVLFLLIGIEVLVINLDFSLLMGAGLVIILVLLTRFFVVALPFSLFKRQKKYAPYVITILTWGGLRGGLAIAMALSLPQSEYRGIILTFTYAVAIFSIVVQGLTIKPLVKLSKIKASDGMK